MASKRKYHANCNVPGCDDEEKSLFALPSSEPLKTEWLHFIYGGQVPMHVPKNVNVCMKHFSEDCFHNLGQYRAGFSKVLKLKTGSVPSLAGRPSSSTHAVQVSHYYHINPLLLLATASR